MSDPDSAQDPVLRAIDATRASFDDESFERGPEQLRSQFAALWASAGAATAVSGLASEAAAETGPAHTGAELLEQARLDAISSAERDALLRRGAELPDLPVSSAPAAATATAAGAKALWVAAATGSALVGLGLTGALLLGEPASPGVTETATVEHIRETPTRRAPAPAPPAPALEPSSPTTTIETADAPPQQLDAERPPSRSRKVNKTIARKRNRAGQQGRRRSRTVDLNELDRQARQAWREGDLQRSVKLFRKILRVSPSSQWAHMAYADLFTIHRRLGEQRTLRDLWRSYLKQFPQGRHAEDARAGLCRSQRPAKRCWQTYLNHYPEGSYAEQARRALDEGQE